MECYLVGGAVRDELLGIVSKDFDYVVVGSTPKEMLSLGYKQVGANFPVFLHPETGDEYALARTEKSTGVKYGDFDCYFGKDVTLKEDLYRRDLTINAIAKDTSTGEYIDPYGGIEDIKNKVLNHVSKAFSEDHVRILRLFRFKATLPGKWSITAETEILVNTMVANGMLQNLAPERVWKEMEKVLCSGKANMFFTTLSSYGMFSEVRNLWSTPQSKEHHPEGSVGVHTEMVMDYASKHYGPLVAFAGLCHDFGKPIAHTQSGNALQHELKGLPVIETFCNTWKVPNKYRELALLVCEHHTKIHGCMGRGSNKPMRPKSIMKLFEATRALSKPARFMNILEACESDAKGRGGDYPSKPYPQKDYLFRCLIAAQDIQSGRISGKAILKGKSGVEIGALIREARINAIREAINTM